MCIVTSERTKDFEVLPMACEEKNPCALAFLTFVNVAFIGLGVGMIIVGIFAVANVSNIYIDQIKPLLDLLIVATVKMDSVTLFRTLCISMVVIGTLLLVVVGVGFGGTCCHNRKALLVYTIQIFIFLSIKIGVIALWFIMKGGVETEIKHEMIEALKDGFKNDTITTEHSISNAWNHLFMKLECCGVNSVVSTTNDFDDTPWCTSSGTCLKTGLQIPRTCCKNVDESSYIFAPSHCYAKIVRGTYNDKGCYDALKDKLLSLKPWIIGGVVLLEIFAVALAIMVRRQGSNYEKAYII